jgi:CHASE2 domain-containing sensor protein
MKSISDISKFSWAELFSNDNGKTSGTGFCGVIICVVGTICFFLGCIDKMWITHTIDVITQSIIFVGIGATLMGFRKVANNNAASIENEAQPEQPAQ